MAGSYHDYQKASFEAALIADRYDQATRNAFSDWLEEQGLDDEAAWQRNWTPEWQKSFDAAEAWLTDFAKLATDNPDNPVTLQEVVAAGETYAKTGQTSMLGEMGFGATNSWDEEVAEAFWLHWHVYTGQSTANKGEGGDPFRCCY